MWMIRSVIVVLGVFVSSSNGQFTCTLGNTDEPACLSAEGDDTKHCVWCNVAGFGFCVNEGQAEQLESMLPTVKCDRYSGGNDDTPTPPSDDTLPDDFWKCLQNQDSKACLEAQCTWCDSNKFGFGLCMTGPTATSAADSAFFTCTNSTAATMIRDPMDTACLQEFLQDPTQQGCTGAVDSDGNTCKWCSLAGIANVCLTQQQAAAGTPFGISCQESQQVTSTLRGFKTMAIKSPKDPFDTACILAFLQDPSEETCQAAKDSDGNLCEFCTFQEQYKLCLSQEQATYAQQFGLDCSSSVWLQEDDASQFTKEKENVQANPYDTSCVITSLSDPTEDGCKAAKDQDGQACEYCSLHGAFNICLTHDQAEMGSQYGLVCGSPPNETTSPVDLLDSTCIAAFAEARGDISPEDCAAHNDQTGEPCEFCSIPGLTNSLCLTKLQVEMTQKFAGDFVQCGQSPKAKLPPNFFECLKEYQEDDCINNKKDCTWCNSQVGIGFCLSDAAARALSDCSFFSCDAKKEDNLFSWMVADE